MDDLCELCDGPLDERGKCRIHDLPPLPNVVVTIPPDRPLSHSNPCLPRPVLPGESETLPPPCFEMDGVRRWDRTTIVGWSKFTRQKVNEPTGVKGSKREQEGAR